MSHNRQKSEAEGNSHHPHTSKFMITFQCLIIAARHINAEQTIMFYCCRLFIIFFAGSSPRSYSRSSPDFATS